MFNKDEIAHKAMNKTNYTNMVDKINSGYKVNFQYTEPQTDFLEHYWMEETYYYNVDKDRYICEHRGHKFITEHTRKDLELMFNDIDRMIENNEAKISFRKISKRKE